VFLHELDGKTQQCITEVYKYFRVLEIFSWGQEPLLAIPE